MDSTCNELFFDYEQNLRQFRDRISGLKSLAVVYHGCNFINDEFFDFDPGKIVMITRGSSLSGRILAELLRTDYSIEVERVCDNYVIAMTSICDTTEGFIRLADALCEIDNRYSGIGGS
jgi:arginine/lysine/ornithine decarboxylase